jgi:hypothetical protein
MEKTEKTIFHDKNDFASTERGLAVLAGNMSLQPGIAPTRDAEARARTAYLRDYR